MPRTKWCILRSHLSDLLNFCIALPAFILCCESVMAPVLQIHSFQRCSRWSHPPFPFQCFCFHLLGWGPRSPLIFSSKFSQLPFSFFCHICQNPFLHLCCHSDLKTRAHQQIFLSPGPTCLGCIPNPISFSSTALPNLHVSHNQLSWNFPPPPWPLQLIHLFSASSKDSQEGSAHTVQEKNNYWITFGFSFKRSPSSCQRFVPLGWSITCKSLYLAQLGSLKPWRVKGLKDILKLNCCR